MENITLLPDEKLIELVRTQDKELYREVVLRYEKALLRYAFNILKDIDEAADIVQSAFIKAFINLNSFDVNKKFSSWIYRIVHNEAMNSISKNKKIISLEDNFIDIKAGDEDMEETIDKKELIHKINICLESMPLSYRIPLALHYLDEKPYDEISDILKLPIGTVGTRINRAKKMMKQIYESKETKYES